MTCTELCQIIETAGKNGVSSLSIPGLNVVYGKEVKALQKEAEAEYFDSLATQHEIEDNVTSDSMEGNDFDLNELAYSDPERYEKIMQGDMDA